MNYEIGLPKKSPAIDLATEPDFALGAIIVQPSLRRIVSSESQEIVEPRIMQVLVTLARAKGSVVSRETLTDNCWGGRIVGDDSINRCMYKIRQFAKLSGGKSFEVETIPRVGYRLSVSLENLEVPGASALSETDPTQPRLYQLAEIGGGKAFDAEAIPRVGHRQTQDRAEAPPQQLPDSTDVVAAAPSPAVSASGGYWRWVALATAAIVIGAGALYFSTRREPEWIIAESHLPFISTPAIERYPALAPDGTMIAYSAGPSIDNRQIYLRLLNGGDPIQLTHVAGDASAPAWSPDSKTIAYTLFKQGQPCRILEIPVPVGQPRPVGRCRFSARSSLAFDSSGRALFFADAPAVGEATRIFKLDLDDGHVYAVTRAGKNAEASDESPSLSPAGELLYNRNTNGANTQIRVLSLSDGATALSRNSITIAM